MQGMGLDSFLEYGPMGYEQVTQLIRPRTGCYSAVGGPTNLRHLLWERARSHAPGWFGPTRWQGVTNS